MRFQKNKKLVPPPTTTEVNNNDGPKQAEQHFLWRNIPGNEAGRDMKSCYEEFAF